MTPLADIWPTYRGHLKLFKLLKSLQNNGGGGGSRTRVRKHST